MEFAFIFLAIIVIGYLVLQKTGAKLKETSQTKQEIIKRYEDQLKDILAKSSEDEKSSQKAQFLKKCNDELSRNIFFTPK